MAQHFLLSSQARSLSLATVARMTEDEARAMFRAIRWAATDGDPSCPRCGCLAVYEYASRPIFKCKGCGHQFSVTSGTIFASHKLPLRGTRLAGSGRGIGSVHGKIECDGWTRSHALPVTTLSN